DYLQRVGLPAIHEHERLLTERAHEVLESVGGIRILGPTRRTDCQSVRAGARDVGRTDWQSVLPAKAGIVSFVVEGVHAHDVAQRLDRHGIAVRAGHHCAMPLHKRLGITASARASFYLYNTLEEVDRLGEALAEIGRASCR